MAKVDFYVLLTPEFKPVHGKRTLKRIKASLLRQNEPDPNTNGLWVRVTIEVPETLFEQIIPHLQAKLSGEQMEAMLAETSDLYMRIVGVDDEDDN